MRELDDFYLQQDEPIKGCLLALREIILSQDKNVSADGNIGCLFSAIKEKSCVTYGSIKNLNSLMLDL
ncbi:MAG: hypothetical protein JWQ40_4673 [Segetibacter sp.]|nr:hypothetical protein [Segetibacter sp.]